MMFTNHQGANLAACDLMDHTNVKNA